MYNSTTLDLPLPAILKEAGILTPQPHAAKPAKAQHSKEWYRILPTGSEANTVYVNHSQLWSVVLQYTIPSSHNNNATPAKSPGNHLLLTSPRTASHLRQPSGNHSKIPGHQKVSGGPELYVTGA